MSPKRSCKPASAGVLLGILLLTAVVGTGAARGLVRVGAYQNPPQVFVEPAGHVRGFYPEVPGAGAAV